jgi:hypothetical protein
MVYLVSFDLAVTLPYIVECCVLTIIICLYIPAEHLWKPGTHKSRNFKIDNVNRRFMRTIGNIAEFPDPPFPSYYNLDALWYPGVKAPFKTTLHGGACCVEFTKEQLNIRDTIMKTHQESLLVGIAHTKVPWRPWYNKASQQEKELLPHTHYVSLFYAFDPHPPFQIPLHRIHRR